MIFSVRCAKWRIAARLLGECFFSLPCYPLVICYIAIENGHRNSGFTELKNGDFP